jgi:hypothetical protein
MAMDLGLTYGRLGNDRQSGGVLAEAVGGDIAHRRRPTEFAHWIGEPVDGYLIRDPDSTAYTRASETAEEFGKRLYLEA